jgi:hypothetical protein
VGSNVIAEVIKNDVTCLWRRSLRNTIQGDPGSLSGFFDFAVTNGLLGLVLSPITSTPERPP